MLLFRYRLVFWATRMSVSLESANINIIALFSVVLAYMRSCFHNLAGCNRLLRGSNVAKT